MCRKTEFKKCTWKHIANCKVLSMPAFWYPAFCFLYKPWSWSFPALTYWPSGELASDNSPVSTPAWTSVNLRRQWKAMVHSFCFHNLSLMSLKKHFYTQTYLEVLEPATQVEEGTAGVLGAHCLCWTFLHSSPSPCGFYPLEVLQGGRK